MRFVRLVVEAFRAIEYAEVHLGPGLNVLYGPNDLGKSTLAVAIRAALLVPPTSSEASHFVSWFADATPRVALTFVDGSDRYWTIRKGFGDASTKGAELLQSKDGSSFTLDCRGREVEERVRAMLGWGILAPGGKSGPRGIPSTFLSNALLAPQTDVDTILEASLATDPDPTGRIRLSKALATLAQDPLFKKVLDAAQHEVDQCFTRTGQRSRAQDASFTKTANSIRALQKELEDRQRQVADSAVVEAQVNALRERRDRSQMRVAESSAALSSARDRLARSRAREDVVARLEAARVVLSDIDAETENIKAIASEIEQMAHEVKSAEDEVSRAAADVETARTAVLGAQDRLRVASGKDGERQRELLQAQLREQAIALAAAKQAAENRKVNVVAAIEAINEAEQAKQASAKARADLRHLLSRLETARQSTLAIATDFEIARATIAYGRWRAALSEAEDAAKATQAAAACTAQANQKIAEAAAFDQSAEVIEADLEARRPIVPSQEHLSLLTELDQQLKVAEARLSGGVSVVLRPRKPVIVHARMDDTEAVDQVDLAIERTLEAERSVHLSIADVLDIEVTVGDVNQRKAVERLRARSKKEIAPALKKAGVRTLNEVVNALAAIAREATAAEGLRKQAMDLRGDAARLFDRAAQETVHASAFARTSDELDARKAAIGDSAPAILEERLAALGRNWEAPAEAWHARKAKEHRTAEGEFAAAEQSAKLAEYKVSEADRRTTEAAAKRDAAVAIAQSSDPASLLISIERELASFGQRQAEVAAKLSALANAAGNEVDKAQRALQAAEQRMVSTKQAHAGAIETLDASRARLNTRTGEINLRRALRETKDRAGAAALFEQCARELAGLPFESGGTEADLAAADRELADARRELDSAKEDLHKSEGALSKVGGMAAREEVERIEEALTAERAREREIETDADAWKLLRDTLREVENEEGAHLGRALAAPVSKKFEELTSGRYADLRFDAMLKAEAVGLRDSPSAASEVLSALSVGTRNQLATLIRLTIAAQLKSAIVLDDHLVHTDPVRLAWFQEVLMKTAVNTQVVVLTCRPEDYLTRNHLAVESPERDVAGGTVRAIDVARAVKRWAVIPSRPPKTMPGE